MWHQFIKNIPVPWSERVALIGTLNLQLDHETTLYVTGVEYAYIRITKNRILCFSGRALARKLGDHLFGMLISPEKPSGITAHKFTNQVQAKAPSVFSMRREIYAVKHLCQVRFPRHLILLITGPELS